jgi:hypothetical protein
VAAAFLEFQPPFRAAAQWLTILRTSPGYAESRADFAHRSSATAPLDADKK